MFCLVTKERERSPRCLSATREALAVIAGVGKRGEESDPQLRSTSSSFPRPCCSLTSPTGFRMDMLKLSLDYHYSVYSKNRKNSQLSTTISLSLHPFQEFSSLRATRTSWTVRAAASNDLSRADKPSPAQQ